MYAPGGAKGLSKFVGERWTTLPQEAGVRRHRNNLTRKNGQPCGKLVMEIATRVI